MPAQLAANPSAQERGKQAAEGTTAWAAVDLNMTAWKPSLLEIKLGAYVQQNLVQTGHA